MKSIRELKGVGWLATVLTEDAFLENVLTESAFLAVLLTAGACCRITTDFGCTGDGTREVTICASCLEPEIKSADPQEDKIFNANLYIYDANGLLETHVYQEFAGSGGSGSGSANGSDGGGAGSVTMKVRTVLGRRCNVYFIANAGYQMPDFSFQQIKDFRWHMAYPDDYARGMIMAGMLENVIIGNNTLEIALERVMAKLSLRMDRSLLGEDVEMSVREVRVGNCPRNVLLFGESCVGMAGDVFNIGFTRDGRQAMMLDTRDAHGLSSEISLYLLENMPSPDVIDGQKVPNRDLASYVEIHMDYLSDKYFTDSGQSLVYRFFIRDGGNSPNGNDALIAGGGGSPEAEAAVHRNCHYHVTVRPHADGLGCDDSWRVDKSGLSVYSGKPYLKLVPSGTTVDGIFYANYYTMGTDDSMHFRVNRYPPSMRISLREDLVEDELVEGRAVYTLDSDNMGFTVKAMGRRCVTMMEIIPSEPLTDKDLEMIVIEIE